MFIQFTYPANLSFRNEPDQRYSSKHTKCISKKLYWKNFKMPCKRWNLGRRNMIPEAKSQSQEGTEQTLLCCPLGAMTPPQGTFGTMCSFGCHTGWRSGRVLLTLGGWWPNMLLRSHRMQNSPHSQCQECWLWSLTVDSAQWCWLTRGSAHVSGPYRHWCILHRIWDRDLILKEEMLLIQLSVLGKKLLLGACSTLGQIMT